MTWMPQLGELVMVLREWDPWHLGGIARVSELRYLSGADHIEALLSHECGALGWEPIDSLRPLDLHNPDDVERWLAS